MASSSSGFRDGQQYHLDLVRLGTALYSFDKEGSAARWLTRITGIKQVRPPDNSPQRTALHTSPCAYAGMPVEPVVNTSSLHKCTAFGMQAYAGDELGYDKTAITTDMRIAVVDVGAMDGADDVTKVHDQLPASPA